MRRRITEQRTIGLLLLVCAVLSCDDGTTTAQESPHRYTFAEFRSSLSKVALYGGMGCTIAIPSAGSDHRFVADSGILYTMYAGSAVVDSAVLLFGTVHRNGDRSLRLPAALPFDYDPDGGGLSPYTVLALDASGRVTFQRDTLQFALSPGERWTFDSTYVETLWTDTSIRCINQCTVRDSVVHYGLLAREQIRYGFFPQ